MSELRYWIWLSTLTNVRPRSKRLLVERLGGVREAFFARDEDYRELGFLSDEEREALGIKRLSGVNEVLGRCEEQNIGIVTMQDAAYPNRLLEIFDPPLVLYVRGKLPNIDDLCSVAVVGTRSASIYGLETAQNMAYGICKCGGLVVSGLTRGVDEAAARGALLANGPCVGVLGVPIDSVRWEGGIAWDVAMAGAVVSEYPPGAKTHPSFFRARNRITSGLSVAALVIEAPARSGALLFADEALGQGREVFAVPGNITAPNSAGSNRLIMEGAHPAVSAWDVLAGFTGRFPTLNEAGRVKKPPKDLAEAAVAESAERVKAAGEDGEEAENEPKKAKSPRRGKLRPKKDIDKPEAEEYSDLVKQLEGLSDVQLKIVSAVTAKHTHVDDIIERSGLPAAQVLGELTMLQIKGYVSQEPGKRFSLNIRQK